MRERRSARRQPFSTVSTVTPPASYSATRWSRGYSSDEPSAASCRVAYRLPTPGHVGLRIGWRAAATPIHPVAGDGLPTGAAAGYLVARRRRADGSAPARHLPHRADERPVSGRVLRRRRMDRQCAGDGAAAADPIVPEHRVPAGRRVDPSDPPDGFSAALQLAEVSG